MADNPRVIDAVANAMAVKPDDSEEVVAFKITQFRELARRFPNV